MNLWEGKCSSDQLVGGKVIITALVGDHRCESAVLITFLAEVDQNCTFSMATFEKCSSDHFLGRS
jgi:hypothetical protein